MLNIKIILKIYFKILKISSFFFFTSLEFDYGLSRMFIPSFYHVNQVSRPNAKDRIFFLQLNIFL